MTAAATIVRALGESARTRPEELEQELEAQSFPVVGDGWVLFAFRGAADEVALHHWIYGLPSSQPLEPLEGTDLWTLRLDLPRRSRIEYKFDVVSEGNNNWIMDPLNPNVAMDPFGANSVCGAYGYERPGWTLPDTEARPGALEEISLESRALNRPAIFARNKTATTVSARPATTAPPSANSGWIHPIRLRPTCSMTPDCAAVRTNNAASRPNAELS